MNMNIGANILIRRASIFAASLAVVLAVAPFTRAQETPPAPGPPRSANIPKPVERTLKNGLRVIVIEFANMPLVSAQLVIKSGGEIDPAALSGAADMTASLLDKGTGTRSAPEIARAIEALGGTLNSGAAWDYSQVAVNVLSPKFGAAMEILADVIRNPAFKEDEIERLRQQYVDAYGVSLTQPSSIANYAAARLIFGDSPYGHPLSGTSESLARIKRADIVQLHSKFYRPDNAILVIGGDIKADAAFKIAESRFGDWAKPQAPIEVSAASAAANSKPRVVVIDMPDSGQAAVFAVHAGIKRTDPDYFRGIVANTVLGGGYSARLNQEIRIKRGLSYGANSSLVLHRNGGWFVASTQTKNESGPEVASLIIGEMARLSSEPTPESELTPRKAVLIGSFGRRLETADGIVEQCAALALHGIPLDQINGYVNSVSSVTPSDVRQFASAHIDPKNTSIVVVGDSKLFIEDLRKRFQSVEVIPIGSLDVNSASLRKPPAG